MVTEIDEKINPDKGYFYSGTPAFFPMCPNLRESDGSARGSKSDVWAVAITVLALVLGKIIQSY